MFHQQPNLGDDIDVAIIGGGCAGLSAASVTSEYGLKTILFEGPVYGGDLNAKTEVGNWPGIKFAYGNQIIPTLRSQAQKWGAQINNESVAAIDFESSPFTLTTTTGQRIKAKKIIISTGTKERQFDLPELADYKDFILYNSDIHGDLSHFSKRMDSKKVAVIGSGIDAMKKSIMAVKNGAEEVHIFARGKKLNLPPWREKYLNNQSNKVKIHFECTLARLEKAENQKIRLHFENEKISSYDADIIIGAIGRIPRNDLFINKLDLDNQGRIKVQHTQETSIKGVFACGDVTDIAGPNPQAAIAAGDGMRAGYNVVESLK
jgi:thioredoxin reductase (NADPH)